MTLEVSRVCVQRGAAALLDEVSCAAPSGALTALVGPNGAGKSTLLKIVAGLLTPTSGGVTFAGTDLAGLRRRTRARLLAFVEQQAATDLDLTVRDVVSLGRIPHLGMLDAPGDTDEAIVSRSMAAARVGPLGARRYRSLSGGERQRVHLAAALAQEPTVLLLDEPTNHLDIRAQLDTLSLLRELATTGLTVLAALHDLGHAAAYADHVVVLADGRVAASGEPDAVLTPALIGKVYGVRADVLTHPVTGRPVLTFSGG